MKMTEYKTKLYKGFICMDLKEEFYEKIAKAGGDGLETTSRVLPDLSAGSARKIRSGAEKFGLRYHSIMHGNAFNSPEETVREDSFTKTVKAVKFASLLGCDSMLSVPVRLDSKLNMPKPHEFKIDFDPVNCKIKSVVAGNNEPYREYIEKHNFAVSMLVKYYERLIPVLAYEGVTLALENVWNNFMVVPELMAAIVKMFNNKWICANYDIGNNVKYRSDPSEGIRLLGSEYIAKIHIKDFIIDHNNKNGGIFVPIGFGDIPWKKVRDAIEEVGYNGWVTLEDITHFTPEEHVQILNQFFAGELTQESAEKIHPYPAAKTLRAARKC